VISRGHHAYQARFDVPGLYMWHCHILEHEDNKMMQALPGRGVTYPPTGGVVNGNAGSSNRGLERVGQEPPEPAPTQRAAGARCRSHGAVVARSCSSLAGDCRDGEQQNGPLRATKHRFGDA